MCAKTCSSFDHVRTKSKAEAIQLLINKRMVESPGTCLQNAIVFVNKNRQTMYHLTACADLSGGMVRKEDWHKNIHTANPVAPVIPAPGDWGMRTAESSRLA